MKTNEKPKGGNPKLDWYPAYASYFVRYLEAMQSHGTAIRAVTMQNEPRNANNTPRMLMTAKEQADFLADALSPALRKADLKTEVILYDHNCDDPAYPTDVLADAKARPDAQGSGFHLYEGKMDTD